MKRVRTALLWASVIALVSVGACRDEVPPPLHWEDFETACDGTPCGWERIRGEDDQAIWVETIHAGEHGLRLTGDVAVRGPGSAGGDFPRSTAGMTLTLMGTCEAGSVLELDVVFADTFGGAHVATATPFVESEHLEPLPAGLTFEGAAPASVTRVTAIAIRKTGAGTCDVSDVVIDDAPLQPGC